LKKSSGSFEFLTSKRQENFISIFWDLRKTGYIVLKKMVLYICKLSETDFAYIYLNITAMERPVFIGLCSNERGQKVSRRNFGEGGKHLSMAGGEIRVTDGPYAEVKEALGGYFAIKATDYDEAVEIAKSCPHMTYGSRIEVRQIDEVH